MILIAGGAGYIGSHINQMLAEKGYETVVFDNLVYGHREAVTQGILEEGDLADTRRLNEIFEKYTIEAVFHFAAYAYVGESVTNPGKYYNNNVANTLHLLDAMVRHEVRNLIFSSTCATYGIPNVIPITENMEQKPINPYGASKLMVERILRDYHNAYDMEYCCLRYFNAAGADPYGRIGESHNPETHLIPLILSAAAAQRENIQVFGTDYPTRDGSCIRDYIHVTDLAEAHIKAMEYLRHGGESTCFNLGNAVGTSVFEVIEAARQVTGKEIPVKLCDRRPGDPPVLVGSDEKAKKILGWKQQYSDIQTILHHAWMWYCNRRY